MKILVIKPSSLGDIVHTLPAVHLLKKSFPESEISWVVNESYAELVERSPDVDEVIIFRRKQWSHPRHWDEVGEFIRKLRDENFDVALDFQGLLRSGIIARFSGTRRRIGFQNARECAGWFYNEKVLIPANISHAVMKNVFLVRSAFHLTSPVEMPELISYDNDKKMVGALLRAYDLQTGSPLIAIAPTSRWPSKTWPVNFFVNVINKLYEHRPDADVVILGTDSEKDIGNLISKGAEGRPRNLMGELNFGMLIEFLQCCQSLLVCDSGPMHLAAALGTPVVALFGATSPEMTGPFFNSVGHVVLTGQCEQAPCFNKECPRGEPVCMKKISTEETVKALLKNV
ncbi:MAG: lipopolysaccharide heptosyltransferase II [Verrucomicrobiota bacterium]